MRPASPRPGRPRISHGLYGAAGPSSLGKILILSNFNDTAISSGLMSRAKQLGKDVGLVKIQKNALLGVTGLKSILLQGYLAFTGDKNTRPFPTEAEALMWLGA